MAVVPNENPRSARLCDRTDGESEPNVSLTVGFSNSRTPSARTNRIHLAAASDLVGSVGISASSYSLERIRTNFFFTFYVAF